MDILTGVGALMVLYGLACGYIALAKPKAIWNTSKLQGFVQLLGEKGTVILLLVVAAGTLIGGVALLLG